MVLEPAGRLVRRRQGEAGRDLGARRAVADDAALGALAERERERVNDDGFAGAGLAGQHRQPGLEGELELGHDGEVADVEVREHQNFSPQWSLVRSTS